jgi:hypothetical protein
MSATLTTVTPRPALLTQQQLAGIFNMDIRSMRKLGIPRVVIAPNEYRYDPADVESFIQERKEVTKP